MNLIIVESPTKARTLTKFLKGKYNVIATMGHIRDLPKSDLGVDVEHDFAPRYIVPRDKMKNAKLLRETAAKAGSVILATDPDREGEAIAWHVAHLLSEEKKSTKKQTKTKSVRNPDSFSRIAFHEITERAIKEALEHPRTIDLKLVDAQQARRVLDRLVGYKLSPLLWQKLSKRWLSAGRVQSVAVRLVVEREREIERFTKKEFWTITGNFNPGIKAALVSKDGIKYEETLNSPDFPKKLFVRPGNFLHAGSASTRSHIRSNSATTRLPRKASSPSPSFTSSQSETPCISSCTAATVNRPSLVILTPYVVSTS